MLTVLAQAWSARRDARVRFLMAQIQMLRAKLPGNRVIVAPEDRRRLLKLGEAMDHQVDDLIGIVSVKTYRKWLREQAAEREPKRVGRRRVVPESLRALILRLARENHGWGIRRIVGELKKLALAPSRSTVRRVMVEEGLLPDPERRAPDGVPTPWRLFVDAHINTMVACDFFCKTISGGGRRWVRSWRSAWCSFTWAAAGCSLRPAPATPTATG
jgi:putative transposase